MYVCGSDVVTMVTDKHICVCVCVCVCVHTRIHINRVDNYLGKWLGR